MEIVSAKALRKKAIMNITWKRLSVILLLASTFASTSIVFAQSWGYRDQGGQQDRRGNDQRQSADRGRQPDRVEQPRRDSKLSPDERRALRQQIDEAGRDIYKPRR
jgi:hypothetical protein